MRYISIRWRLVLSYVLLTVLTISVVGGLALAFIQRNLSERESELLRANAEAVARQAALLFTRGGDRADLQTLADTAAFLSNAQVRILDRDGDELVDSGPRGAADRLMWVARAQQAAQARSGMLMMFGMASAGRASPMDIPELRELMRGDTLLTVEQVPTAWGSALVFREVPIEAAPAAAPEEALPESAVRVRAPVVSRGAALGAVELSSAALFNAEALSAAQRALLLSALVAGLLAIVLGLWVSQGLTAPLRGLAAAAGRMAQGDLSARAGVKHPGSRDEIDELAQQFNGMAERLESSFGQLSSERDALRRFVADASHELRTPITSLAMANELLQGPAGADPAARAEFLTQNAAQLKRLEWITSNLLDLSRLDAGIAQLALAEHDAHDLLDAAAQPHRAVAEARGIALTVERGEPLAVTCDRARVEIALSNLIDNALKFTPRGESVIVSAEASASAARLLVRDTGIGVAAEDQARVFERFYRGANHRAEGSGLGLAIVKSIALAHGGDAFVESAPGQGSTFGIELPRG